MLEILIIIIHCTAGGESIVLMCDNVIQRVIVFSYNLFPLDSVELSIQNYTCFHIDIDIDKSRIF